MYPDALLHLRKNEAMADSGFAGNVNESFILDVVAMPGTAPAGFNLQNLRTIQLGVAEPGLRAPRLLNTLQGFLQTTIYPSYSGVIPMASKSLRVRTGLPTSFD